VVLFYHTLSGLIRKPRQVILTSRLYGPGHDTGAVITVQFANSGRKVVEKPCPGFEDKGRLPVLVDLALPLVYGRYLPQNIGAGCQFLGNHGPGNDQSFRPVPRRDIDCTEACSHL